MRTVRRLLLSVIVLSGVGLALQWNAAKVDEQAAYAASATPETAHTYGEWVEQRRAALPLHYKLLVRAGALQAHALERKQQHEEYQQKLAQEKAAAEAAAKAAAELKPEQRRAKWLEEYKVSGAAAPENVRGLMTALLTRAAADQRDVPLKLEVATAVNEPALKKALEAIDLKQCRWDARKTHAYVSFAPGDAAAEGVLVRLIWLDGKDPLDVELTEKGKPVKKKLKQAKAGVSIDLRAPKTQPVHVEQDGALDTADFGARVQKDPSIADPYPLQAESLGATACAKVGAMLGLKDL